MPLREAGQMALGLLILAAMMAFCVLLINGGADNTLRPETPHDTSPAARP